MIPFFRKIRKKMADDNRPLKYMRYAIGEILLVVIGILIALSINNWNQERKLNRKEIHLLSELIHNLETNISNLEKDIKSQIRSAGYIDFLIEHIENKRPYHDSLAVLFAKADYAPDVVLASSAYETLKSLGLEIISSDTIRREIINLFEISYPTLLQETKRLEDQLWPAVVIPLYQKHFKLIEGKAIPNNYNLLLLDIEFVNMLAFRGKLRKSSTKQKKNEVQNTLRIINLLNKELYQNMH